MISLFLSFIAQIHPENTCHVGGILFRIREFRVLILAQDLLP